MGALYQSYNDVRLEKARVNQLFQQLDAVISDAAGAPTAINQTTGETVNQLSILVPTWEEEGTDNIEQLVEDWDQLYSSWQGFMATGVDQTSTLWFPNFPDGGEWQACMQYEAALAAMQTRANNVLNAGVPVIQATETPAAGPSLTNLFPMLPPSVSTTVTNALWVAGIGYVAILAFPILKDITGFAGAAGSYAIPKRRSGR